MSKVKKDFDWDLVEGKGFGGNYTTEQKEKMEAAIEATLNSVTEKEVVKGIVVSKTDREVIINIGFKSDGCKSSNPGPRFSRNSAVAVFAKFFTFFKKRPTEHIINIFGAN